MKNTLSVFIIMLCTLFVQLVVGIDAVIFPVQLDKLGYNNAEVGYCLSLEIFAVLCISGYISKILSTFGFFWPLLIASVIRGLVLYCLSIVTNYWAWLVCIFFLGMSTNIFLISMQTWLGSMTLGRFTGLAIGLYSGVLSAGVALGPIVLDYIGMDTNFPFIFNGMLCIATFLPFVVGVYLLPKIPAEGKPRVLYVLRNAAIVMSSAFVGGITFFGLPAFSTLFGMQNGLEPEKAAYLISAFMLGSIIFGFILSSISSFIGTGRLTVICVFIGLCCAVYLPLAIKHYELALGLLFVWGGVAAGIYAMGLANVASMFRKEDLVSANVTYGLMDCMGGVVGVALIGSAMELWQAEGLSYIIVTAGVIYFTFILSQRRVEAI